MDSQSSRTKKIEKIGNMELHEDENYVLIRLNPDIYALDVAYSAAYIMLDRAFIVLDGDPKKEILVTLKPKDQTKQIDELGREFNNELINYAVYKIQSEKNKVVKESIVQRALNSNQETPEVGFEDEGFSKVEKDLNKK